MRRAIADALAAYALGAVGGAESRAIVRALRADPLLRRQADADRDTVARLVARFEPVEPDRSVWGRIERAIGGDSITPAPPRAQRLGRAAMLTVAVAAAFVLGVGASTVLRTASPTDVAAVAAELRDDPSTNTLRLSDPGSGADVATVLVGSDGTAIVSGDGLPVLDAGLTYQLWAVVDGAVVSAGLLGAEASATALRLEAEPTVLAVTVERTGGVVVSEHEPVAVWSADA